MTSPLVTIAIPTYNRAEQLARCLASAVGQSYRNLEILVCDNASTDHTGSVVSSMADGRVRYLCSDVNQGPIANFLRGLELARGEYFMWLADDDWLAPDFISCCVARLSADPAVVLANGDVHYVSTAGAVVLERATVLAARSAGQRIRRYYRSVVRNGVFYGLSRTEIRRKAPLDVSTGSDWVHVAAIAAHGVIAAVPALSYRSLEGASSKMDYDFRRMILPMAVHLGAETVRNRAFGHMSATSRVASALVATVTVAWRFGPGSWVDLCAGGAVLALRPRLAPSTYDQVRRAYRRLRSGRSPAPSERAGAGGRG